jgi:DNA-binding PadR family transcriptional regulator
MSFTQLLVLGAVRQFQPVHGYFVRRELRAWHADEWANLNPGSVYNAMRKLETDGLLRQVEASPLAGRPARTTYAVTPFGEETFLRELRDAIAAFTPHEPGRLLVGISFMTALPRDVIIAALRERASQIEQGRGNAEREVAEALDDPKMPDRVAESIRLRHVRTIAELGWIQSLVSRLEIGEYRFDGEPPREKEADPAPLARRASDRIRSSLTT